MGDALLAAGWVPVATPGGVVVAWRDPASGAVVPEGVALRRARKDAVRDADVAASPRRAA